jgi:hypothetical protein
MDAGRLDRRIVILRATSRPTSFNEHLETWATLADRLGAWPRRSGRRAAARGRNPGEQVLPLHDPLVLDVADVDPRDRVVFDGRTYDVHGAKEIGRREVWKSPPPRGPRRHEHQRPGFRLEGTGPRAR